jgi:hypothetical protein
MFDFLSEETTPENEHPAKDKLNQRQGKTDRFRRAWAGKKRRLGRIMIMIRIRRAEVGA